MDCFLFEARWGPGSWGDRSQEAGQVLKGVVAEGAKTLDNIIISLQTDTYARIITGFIADGVCIIMSIMVSIFFTYCGFQFQCLSGAFLYFFFHKLHPK